MENGIELCRHRQRSDLECTKISLDDIKKIRRKFFLEADKNIQDNKLAQLLQIVKPKRSRSRKPDGQSQAFSVKYFVSSKFLSKTFYLNPF